VLEDIVIPSEARMSVTVPTMEEVDVNDPVSVEHALVASAGVKATGGGWRLLPVTPVCSGFSTNGLWRNRCP